MSASQTSCEAHSGRNRKGIDVYPYSWQKTGWKERIGSALRPDRLARSRTKLIARRNAMRGAGVNSRAPVNAKGVAAMRTAAARNMRSTTAISSMRCLGPESHHPTRNRFFPRSLPPRLRLPTNSSRATRRFPPLGPLEALIAAEQL